MHLHLVTHTTVFLQQQAKVQICLIDIGQTPSDTSSDLIERIESLNARSEVSTREQQINDLVVLLHLFRIQLQLTHATLRARAATLALTRCYVKHRVLCANVLYEPCVCGSLIRTIKLLFTKKSDLLCLSLRTRCRVRCMSIITRGIYVH